MKLTRENSCCNTNTYITPITAQIPYHQDASFISIITWSVILAWTGSHVVFKVKAFHARTLKWSICVVADLITRRKQTAFIPVWVERKEWTLCSYMYTATKPLGSCLQLTNTRNIITFQYKTRRTGAHLHSTNNCTQMSAACSTATLGTCWDLGLYNVDIYTKLLLCKSENTGIYQQNLPLQLFPFESRLYPMSHSQEKLPTESMHICWQSFNPAHSSMSVEVGIVHKCRIKEQSNIFMTLLSQFLWSTNWYPLSHWHS